MEKLLTIVVPAYNMEALLPRCLDSLIVPTEVMERVEVLVINDGSRDGTLAVAQAYAARFPGYITAIDKPNGGYGSVMNLALARATGKYFKTLDADDWYDTQAYAAFVKELALTEADLVVSERQIFHADSGRTTLDLLPPDTPTGRDMAASAGLWGEKTFNRALVAVMTLNYRTDLLRKSGLRWDEGVLYTDVEYGYWPLRLVETVRFVRLPVYIYFVGRNEQSMNPAVIRRNGHSLLTVAHTIVRDYVKTHAQGEALAPIREFILRYTLSMAYLTLLFSPERADELRRLDSDARANPVLRRLIDDVNYHGLHYARGLDSGHPGWQLHAARGLMRLVRVVKNLLGKA